jgi:hypothetical protein
MPFTLPLGHKFGALCLVNAAVDRDLRDRVLDLPDDVSAIFGPPFEIEAHWRVWLGSVKSRNLAQTSLALLAHNQSNRPEILDGENEAMLKTASSIFYGLLMAEVFHHDSGLLLSGANPAGAVSVRQVSDLEPHIRPNGVHVHRISEITLQRAAKIATGLRATHAPAPRYARLQRGFEEFESITAGLLAEPNWYRNSPARLSLANQSSPLPVAHLSSGNLKCNS